MQKGLQKESFSVFSRLSEPGTDWSDPRPSLYLGRLEKDKLDNLLNRTWKGFVRQFCL